jgi:hypothetical protein
VTTTSTGPRHGSGWDASFDEAVAVQPSRRSTRRRVVLPGLGLFLVALARIGTALTSDPAAHR